MTKKEQIIEAAKSLFRDIGYHHTSIQDILEKSGVSKGTFYNYFSSKPQLILNIIQNVDAKVEEQQKQLLAEGDPHSKEILYSQLGLKHAIYSRENILELYNISMAENDEALRKYIVTSHYKELNWLARRLIEVYGVEIEASAMDLSTHFIGGIGYQFRYSNQMSLDTNSSDILSYNIVRLEKNIEITKQHKHVLFPFHIENNAEDQEVVVAHIRNLLAQEDTDRASEEQELIDFILDECQNPRIRWSICEGIARQLKVLSSSSSTKDRNYNELFNMVYKQARKSSSHL
ncbi:TetR/AcrR family transcriptional regulator [Paenibacillus brasilensis]|uniref:AcrR family transcriptional regulator n=1 Tax=Paenibacillus brasilensis TaxID=128574 RepID=A0ABU0L2P3_9BACL|nr:TetR/AcrR family transcriptional regulator [Paenibacillus brasilensis]MDQ0495355.1 AcrR family transcriptional regulator [Paenibacillus brasilensis]